MRKVTEMWRKYTDQSVIVTKDDEELTNQSAQLPAVPKTTVGDTIRRRGGLKGVRLG